MCPRRSAGFTLPEVLVVLVILGLVTSLALPDLLALYEGVARRTTTEKFVQAFNGLGRVAYLNAATLSVSASDGRLVVSGAEVDLDVAGDWTFETDGPILWQANGACTGGRLLIVSNGEKLLEQTLDAPFCRVSTGGS